MVSRPPGPGRHRWLEWGPTDPGAGGGSQVRDIVDAPVRTGSRVADVEHGHRVGTVIALLAVDSVRVHWALDEPEGASEPGTLTDPDRLRVIG